MLVIKFWNYFLVFTVLYYPADCQNDDFQNVKVALVNDAMKDNRGNDFIDARSDENGANRKHGYVNVAKAPILGSDSDPHIDGGPGPLRCGEDYENIGGKCIKKTTVNVDKTPTLTSSSGR